MSQWLFHIDRKISYRKKSSACSDIFSVSRSKLQPQGRSIVKDQERMVQLECTNIKKGRVLEIRPRILGQTSFQLHDTVAPGWFSMIDRVSSQDFLHMVSHLYLSTRPQATSRQVCLLGVSKITVPRCQTQPTVKICIQEGTFSPDTKHLLWETVKSE